MKFTRCRRMNHIGMCSSYSTSNIVEFYYYFQFLFCVLCFFLFFFFFISLVFFIINKTRLGSSSESMTKFKISNCEMKLFSFTVSGKRFVFGVKLKQAPIYLFRMDFNFFVQRKCYCYHSNGH